MTPEQLERRRKYRREWARAHPKQWAGSKLHYQKNKARMNQQNYERKIQLKFGITFDAYTKMLVDQNGVCAICFTSNWGHNRKRPAVDHDHKTGKVRGLLCTQCNLALGYFEDNPERFISASQYLKRIR